jgi:ATP-binding cassette subfamily B protein
VPRFGHLLPMLHSAKIPVVLQLSPTECGAACLAMVLQHHRKYVPLDELRVQLGVGRDGTNAREIIEGARAYGLNGRGVRVDADEVELLPAASILHWEFSHFVVFERLGDGWVEIIDPNAGRRRVPFESFRRAFTGVALLFEPAADFEPSRAPPRIWLRYLKQIQKQSPFLWRILTTSAILELVSIGLPAITGAVVDRVVPRGDLSLLSLLACTSVLLALFHFFTTWVRSHLLLHLRTLLDARTTTHFLEHMVRLPFSFFQLHPTGDLLSRVDSNSTIRELLTTAAASAVLDGAMVLGSLGLVLALSPGIGVGLVVLGALQVLVFALTRRRQIENAGELVDAQAKCRAYLVEVLGGMQTLKGFGAEHRALERWSNLYADMLNSAVARSGLEALVQALLGALHYVSSLLVIIWGAWQVVDGQMSLGFMLAVNALAMAFLTPVSTFVDHASRLQVLSSHFRRMDSVLQTPVEQDRSQARRAPALQGRLELEQVSFRYTSRAPWVVKDVSLTILPGQFVAVVGPSGAGKSSLAMLMLGMYLPTSGRVLFDGADLSSLDLQEVRRQIGLVNQQPALFRGTIRSNIALANPMLPFDEVMRAAKIAQIHDEIMNMPMGYDTELSDMGGAISGGQRQRIALARALACRPALLLLDEATNALDTVSERKVQQSLDALHCTRVVIAHRLSTVERADVILVMEGGALVASGTHEELLGRCALYESLVHGTAARTCRETA